jgi:membrane-associated phospholipid phosphatase
VAAAFGPAFARLALPERRWVSCLLFAIAFLIAIATVYGRYHYIADARAGLLMAAFAIAFVWRGAGDRACQRLSGQIPEAEVSAEAA